MWGPRILDTGYGYCKTCHTRRYSLWRKNNLSKIKIANKKCYDKHAEQRRVYRKRYYEEHHEAINANLAKYANSSKGKHNKVTFLLRREGIPKTDALWNRNFYIELIRDNECHYCLGPLSKVGCSLDRMDNSLGHASWNVVPCCTGCNQKKMHDTSYEEMMLLAPALREIRRRREVVTIQQ